MICKDCKERHLHCHSTCEKYNDFLKENEQRKAKIRKAKEEEWEMTGYVIQNRERYIRGHNPTFNKHKCRGQR